MLSDGNIIVGIKTYKEKIAHQQALIDELVRALEGFSEGRYQRMLAIEREDFMGYILNLIDKAKQTKEKEATNG